MRRTFPVHLLVASLAVVMLLGGCARRKSLPPAPEQPVATAPASASAPVTAKSSQPASADRIQVDRIMVDKDQRRMVLLKDGREVRAYTISLGRNPVGHKEKAGDGRTPEGVYEIVLRNDQSRFYRSLRISYPSPEDRAHAAALGVSPGGDIMIHGLPNGKGWIGDGQNGIDWTEGCIAVTNEDMDELLRVVKPGVPIEIRA